MAGLRRDMLKVVHGQKARSFNSQFYVDSDIKHSFHPPTDVVTTFAVTLQEDVRITLERMNALGDSAMDHAREAAYRQMRFNLYGDMYDKIGRARSSVEMGDYESSVKLLSSLLDYIHGV